MIGIEPTSSFRVISGMMLDTNYNNTIYFKNADDQLNYFLSKPMLDLGNEFSYIRKEDKIRVEVPFSQMSTFNYCMYQNSYYNEKWVYAFIIDCEYVNDVSCDLYIMVDVMQTFAFNYVIAPCYVEREHVDNDNIPSWTPENLEHGEYRVNMRTAGGINANGQLIVVASTVDNQTGQQASGRMYGNVYSGLLLLPSSSITNINAYIKSVVDSNKMDSIVTIFMMPQRLWSGENSSPATYNVNIAMSAPFGGYVPRNKKLYMHPYNMLHVTNGQGVDAQFKWELFSGIQNPSQGGNCTFTIVGLTSPNPKAFCYPLNYAGDSKNYEHGISIGNFPQCAFTTDTYRAYLAQNANSLEVTNLANAYNVGMGALNGAMQGVQGGNNFSQLAGMIPQIEAGGIASKTIGGITGAITGAMGGVIATMGHEAKMRDISTLPAQAHGASGSDIFYSLGLLDFQFRQLSITPSYAKLIDDYFDRFGYAVNTIKVPSRNNRKTWTYVKTRGANIYGALPQKYINIIKSNFDKGITFWTHGDNISNYTLNNDTI